MPELIEKSNFPGFALSLPSSSLRPLLILPKCLCLLAHLSGDAYSCDNLPSRAIANLAFLSFLFSAHHSVLFGDEHCQASICDCPFADHSSESGYSAECVRYDAVHSRSVLLQQGWWPEIEGGREGNGIAFILKR